jgi:hypothetical protein
MRYSSDLFGLKLIKMYGQHVGANGLRVSAVGCKNGSAGRMKKSFLNAAIYIIYTSHFKINWLLNVKNIKN